MTNPRKFSEKIALIQQKQQEEEEAFRRVMEDVHAVTACSAPRQHTMPQPTPGNGSRLLPPSNQTSMLRGGSLPDVHSGSISQQGDLRNTSHGGRMMGSGSPRSSRAALGPGPMRAGHRPRTDTSPYASPTVVGGMNHNPSSNPIPVGSPRSSYGQHYLQPPPEWRRVHSDPALHKSPTDNTFIPLVVPDSSNSEDSSNNSNDPRDIYTSLSHITSRTQDSPNALGNGGIVQSHLGVTQPNISTGSLPDLTNPGNIQFPLPVDIDGSSAFSTRSPGQNSVTYSSNSINSHPLTITLGMLQQQQQQHQQQQQQQQQQNQNSQQHQQQQQMSPGQAQSPGTQSQHSPQILENLHLNPPFQNFPTNDNQNMYNYRCPPRPSPQNSPFRSPSPLDHLSNPPSPITQPNQNPSAESYTNNLHQTFEQQVSLNDRSGSNGTWQSGVQDYYYSPSASSTNIPGNQQQSPQLPQPPTPQTPGSIPEIVFSDFCESGRFVDAVQEFLEEADINAMRDGIDSDGLEMLRNPNLIITSEPNAEDAFRLDRLDCERELADYFNS